jgi:Lon protease-like protein
MFPLEHAILPSMLVPLHIFEPRYRQFARDLQEMTEPSFGIVGIERGREVGGDDQRFDVGVVMRLLGAEEFPDGRWALTAVASRRLTVHDWLSDDPYPRATVQDRHDDIDDDQDDAAVARDRDALVVEFGRLAESVRRRHPQVDLLADLGQTDDLDWRTWELVSRSGLGPLDHVALLRCDDPAKRTRLAIELIADRRALFDALAEGDR